MNTTKQPPQITLNTEQRLYVIPCGNGFSCLGFDVAETRRAAYLNWLGFPVLPVDVGTLAAYSAYTVAVNAVHDRHKRTGERCPAELIPQLIGKEGKRVELTYPDGTKTRFIVGKSCGWIPCHLEIKRRDSSGGGAVYFPAGSTVRVIR